MRFPRQTAVNNLSSRVLGERAWLLYGGVMPVFNNPRRTPCFGLAPTLEDFEAIAAEALALQEAGCFAIVLEGIPAALGATVSR